MSALDGALPKMMEYLGPVKQTLRI